MLDLHCFLLLSPMMPFGVQTASQMWNGPKVSQMYVRAYCIGVRPDGLMTIVYKVWQVVYTVVGEAQIILTGFVLRG